LLWFPGVYRRARFGGSGSCLPSWLGLRMGSNGGGPQSGGRLLPNLPFASALGPRHASSFAVRRHSARLCLEERQVLRVALLLQPLHGNEAQRSRAQAVAQAGRRGPVGEDVSQMRVCVRGSDFGSLPEEPAV